MVAVPVLYLGVGEGMVTKPDTIGARIRYWRMRRGGMTQAVLAGLAGVTQSYVSQIESGRKTIDRRSTLVALAAALQVTVADLLGQGTESGDPAGESAAECVPAIWSALKLGEADLCWLVADRAMSALGVSPAARGNRDHLGWPVTRAQECHRLALAALRPSVGGG